MTGSVVGRIRFLVESRQVAFPMSEHLPIVELWRMHSPSSECAYLPEQQSRYDCRAITQISAADYERLLERGWRRQGLMFFRPHCSGCRQCVGLRVNIAAFRPSRSQRRNLRRNRAIRVEVGRPQLTDAHLRLFNDYHRSMHHLRGWELHDEDFENYERTFLSGEFPFEREFRYWNGNELAGVALVDQVPSAISSIYFYHAPEWRSRGPGTFSILQELEYARRHRLDFNYLGYWIEPCGSMAYKNRFEPHELLDEFVDESFAPSWTANQQGHDPEDTGPRADQ